MSKLDPQAQAAVRRLAADLQELENSPIENISALPLEDNMFEWHCNFKGSKGTSWEGVVFHVILFFPSNYPAKSPSAEFVPSFKFTGGGSSQGTKGTKVCLSIFSDFAYIHTEWANEKGTGWSPSYTVQSVLLNLVSFITETTSGSGYFGYGQSSMSENAALAKNFRCKDCGHTHDKPYPPLSTSNKVHGSNELDALTCYVTKRNILKPGSDIFGFGIIKSGPPHNLQLTSPCECMTLEGFNMLASNGKVESVMREEVHSFLPLYISEEHGKNITKYFEDSCAKILGSSHFDPLQVLSVLPKLLNSTVVTFMNGTTHTSERALHGYFAYHQLFLWAVRKYKDALVPEIRRRIEQFVKDPNTRTKKNTPNVGEWLSLLTVSEDYTWQDVKQAYISENFLRNVMWYLRQNPRLENTANNNNRVEDTFALTQVSRNLLAFQVLFLDIACPQGMSTKQIEERYCANYGMPTKEMEEDMKQACKKIKAIKDYFEWFEVIKMEKPTYQELVDRLVDSIKTAKVKEGYHDKPKDNNHSGQHNRDEGRRDGNRGGYNRGGYNDNWGDYRDNRGYNNRGYNDDRRGHNDNRGGNNKGYNDNRGDYNGGYNGNRGGNRGYNDNRGKRGGNWN